MIFNTVSDELRKIDVDSLLEMILQVVRIDEGFQSSLKLAIVANVLNRSI